MTLRDYLKIFRQRWWVIVVTTLLVAGVVFVITPAKASTKPPASSYTATATLLASDSGGQVSLERTALYITTGKVPQNAAQALDYAGDPAILVEKITVATDSGAGAITIAATDQDGEVAAARANAFADAAVKYFRSQSGVDLSVLQSATPIPNDPAGGAVVPPSRTIRTGLGAVIGLLLGLALAIVLDHLDSRLRTRDQIGRATGMPIVAEIPRLPRDKRRKGAVLVRDEPLSTYADGYRAARSALIHVESQPIYDDLATRRGMVATADQLTHPGTSAPTSATPGGRVILVTSALAGEGKSTCAANIAASFAETGKKVLVVDADLRSPDINELFDVPQGAGASDFLVNHERTRLASLVRPTNVEGVGIVTAGTHLDYPASLTSRMAPLVKAARRIADVVILDASPILEASDAFDLLPLTDAVLLVVRSGRLTAPAAERTAELLGRFQVPIAGVVVIAVPKSAGAGYGYGFGDGYGYGQKRRKGRKGRSEPAAPTPAPPPSQVPAPAYAPKAPSATPLTAPATAAAPVAPPEQPRRARPE